MFSKDSSWIKPSGLVEEKKLLIVVTHDESIFNANNGKKKEKSPLPQKGKGKRIMASEFPTPVRRLHVPDSVSDHQLLQHPN